MTELSAVFLLDELLQYLRQYRSAKRGEWSRKQPSDEKMPPTSLFTRHMEGIISCMKNGRVICSASGNSSAGVFSSLLSDNAVIHLSKGITDLLALWWADQIAPERVLPWEAVTAVENFEPLIRDGRLRILAQNQVTGTMTWEVIYDEGLNDDLHPEEHPSWYVWDGIKIHINAPTWRREIAGDAFHDSLRKAKLVTLGEIDIPIFTGISAQQLVELLHDEPSVTNLRDAVEQTLNEIARDPSQDRIEDLISQFKREIRNVEREHRQIISRRHNTMAGVGLGTGLLALGFLVPEDYALFFRAAASALGSVTIWSGSTDIWKEKSRHKNMPFYLAWKAHRLQKSD